MKGILCYWMGIYLNRVAWVTLSIKQHAYGFLDRFPASIACGRANGLGTPTNGFVMVALDAIPAVNPIPSADCERVIQCKHKSQNVFDALAKRPVRRI